MIILKALLLTVLTCTFCNASGINAIPYALTDILPSSQQIERDTKNFAVLADNQLDLFKKASAKGNYDEAYEAWSDLCIRFFSLKLLFGQIQNLSPDAVLKTTANSQFQKMLNLFRRRLQDKSILDTFTENGLAAAALTPLQREITEKILQSSLDAHHPSLKNLAKYERNNFDLKQFPAKSNPPVDTLRVFTANILCFPDNLSYLYGGVSEWPERIDRIVAKIFETDADIVSLQEVWDPKVMRALVDLLKSKYCYFVYDAGNQFTTLKPQDIGINSGLFVASRFPLDFVSFTPFVRTIPPHASAKRGALEGLFSLSGTEWAFVTTHMQHGSAPPMAEIRQEQLGLCIDLLKINRQNGFLMGDLNIDAFSTEFSNSRLAAEFAIPYLQGQTGLTPENATCTDYFNDLIRTPPDERSKVKPTYELLDYCAGFKGSNLAKPLSQEKIPLFSIEDPSAALSDHHGILTVWKTSKD